MSDEERIKELEEEKAKIDRRIASIRKKQDLRFDSARIKEHFMLIDETARKLKYDFSEIEYNFRELNTLAMEQISSNSDAKGSVIGTIFEIEERIRESDQGKSFFGFWQLLTNSEQNEKFSYLLEKLYEIETIAEFDKEQRLKDLKFELLQSGDKITKVSAKLIEQLRRFIDDRIWLENKRVLELCKSIQKRALKLKKEEFKQKAFIYLDLPKIKVDSVFEKSLYAPKEKALLKAEVVEEVIDETLVENFYDIFYVDEERLKNNLNRLLLHKPQVRFSEVLESFPVEKGVAEVISYLSIIKRDFLATVSEDVFEILTIESEDGIKKIKIPKIIVLKEK